MSCVTGIILLIFSIIQECEHFSLASIYEHNLDLSASDVDDENM
jgi:hypothetical protein